MVKIYENANKKNSEERLYTIRNGVRIYCSPLRPGERAVIYNAFEPVISRIFCSMVTENSVVYDVGSWIGYYALLAARNGAGKVVAIEADPENFRRINQNIGANRSSNVIEAKLLGVSNHRGFMKVERRKNSHIMSHVIEGKDGEIPLDTLDKVVNEEESIDLMMMDIEGHEIFALQGAKNILKEKKIRKLLIEVHPNFLAENGQSDKELIDLLESQGYHIQIIKSNNTSIYHLLASS